MNILMYNGSSPNETMDLLADGFMRWLGKEQVRLRFKFSGGRANLKFQNFHPVYAWADQDACTWPEEAADLAILSIRTPAEWAEELAPKLRCPSVSINDDDHPAHMWGHCKKPMLLFVKECHGTEGFDSPELVRPLPYGVIPEPIGVLPPWKTRTTSIFFAGLMRNERRTQVFKMITELGGVARKSTEPHTGYTQELANTKIGVSPRGGASDNYRSWEICYWGGALVAQKFTHIVPNNLIHGTEALWYTEMDECQHYLEDLLKHPDKAEAMAKAGRAKVLAYHTNVHRAMYVVQEVHKLNHGSH